MALAGKDYSMLQKPGGGLAKRKLNVKEKNYGLWSNYFFSFNSFSSTHWASSISFGTIWSFS